MIHKHQKLGIALAVMVSAVISAQATAQEAGCIAYSSSDIRTFQIKKIIKVGMREADVKRVWGNPTKIRHNYPADNEWEFWNPTGDQIVTFGRHGCVTGWYTARD